MKSSRNRMEEILDILKAGELSALEISERIGLSRSPTLHYIGMLYDNRKIHVSGYEKAHQAYARRFSLGNKPDMPPPFVDNRERPRVKQPRKAKAKPARRDPLVAAFFGAVA